MTKRLVKLAELPNLTRKQMAHQILNKRDVVGITAKQAARAANSAFKGTAPYGLGRNGGHMRDATNIEATIGTAKVVIPSGTQMRKINAVNKYGKNKGFYDRYKKRMGQYFFSMVRGSLR